MRLGTQNKITKVEQLIKSGTPKLEAIKKAGISANTYYRHTKGISRKTEKRSLGAVRAQIEALHTLTNPESTKASRQIVILMGDSEQILNVLNKVGQ